jgi:hypothetical protein
LEYILRLLTLADEDILFFFWAHKEEELVVFIKPLAKHILLGQQVSAQLRLELE